MTGRLRRSSYLSNSLQTILGRREVREFASGALAGAMSKAILAPLETIRYSETLISMFCLCTLIGQFIFLSTITVAANPTASLLNTQTVILVFVPPYQG